MQKRRIVWIVAGLCALLGVGQDSAFALCSMAEGQEDLPCDFAALEPVQIEPLSPLEQRIQELEFAMQNYGRSAPPDPATFDSLKLLLAPLYDQLPRESSPLDDGADACPAVDLPNNIQPYTDYGTTIGAVNNFNPITPCGTTFAPDKIYRFIPANTGNYTFDTFGSQFDTQLYINTGGACPGNTQVACNDDYGGSQSRVQVWMYAGQTYYIIVDGFQGYSGNFVLHLWIECAIGNSSLWQQECAESVGDPSHAAWDCNGGCNNQWYGGFPQWQQMNLCQFMRGTCFTYQDPNNISIRDIDSYYFTLTEPCQVQLNLFSTFSYNILLNDYGYCIPVNHVTLLNIPSCNGGMYVTQCLPAGTYSLEISPNFYSGMTTPQPYFISVDPIPCSGCRVDGLTVAPSSFTANGCDNISHNSLRPSNDATYCVVIPYASDWTFSVCGSIPWDSYIYLTTACDGQIVAQDNDGCAPGGLSKIECLPLMPGNYYLTIEGNTALDCGQFYVTITECAGACCYGDDVFNMQCSYGSLTACNILGGEFSLGQQCDPEQCGVRPQCEGATPMFSQLPHLPTESWTAVASDAYPNYSLWEDYSTSGAFTEIRFWGLFTDYSNGQPCINQPCNFQITFVDSSGPTTQTYTAAATGYQVPQNYGAQFPVYQYDVDLWPPCSIPSGRVSVRATDGDPCVWAWVSSPQGNGSVVIITPGGPTNLPMDVSLCIERGCSKPDSVTIRKSATDVYDIRFHVYMPQWVTLYYTTDANATYPTNYSSLGTGYLGAGNWLVQDLTPDPSRRYVLTSSCTVPPIASDGPGIFQRSE